jgi:hypothetical protein
MVTLVLLLAQLRDNAVTLLCVCQFLLQGAVTQLCILHKLVALSAARARMVATMKLEAAV